MLALIWLGTAVYKTSLVPGSGVGFMLATLCLGLALLWPLARAVNGPLRGLPRLYAAGTAAGALFGLWWLMYALMVWPGPLGLALLCVPGLAAWWQARRQPEQPLSYLPLWPLRWLAPLLMGLALASAAVPEGWRYETFHPLSRRLSYTQYKAGWYVKGGQIIRPTTP